LTRSAAVIRANQVVGVRHPLSPLIAQRERQRVGDFVRRGGAEMGGRVGHAGIVEDLQEHIKNFFRVSFAAARVDAAKARQALSGDGCSNGQN
jgi:hypothetical protein